MDTQTKAAAIEVFERFENAKEVFITPDGQAFLAKDRAILHNKDVTEVKRKEVMSDEKSNDQDSKKDATKPELAEVLIVKIAEIKSIEELDAFLPEGEKRKTVVAAIEARRVELTAAQNKV